MAVINMLPMGGAGIKGSKIFAWLEDGVIDSSESFGGMAYNEETNGRTNLDPRYGDVATDGYLRLYNISGGNGRVMISTENLITANAYDYVLFHIVSLTTTTANQPLTWGGKTAKSATAPTVGTYTVGNTSLTGKWVAFPLTMLTSSNYLAFGGTIDCTIDKIYFVKVK